MRVVAGLLNLVLGLVYISYGWITIADLRKNWQRFKPERLLRQFAYAWIAMAFTCGPHHLTHGLHLLTGVSPGAGVDVYVIAIGFPAGLMWFGLQLEGIFFAASETVRLVKVKIGWSLALASSATVAAVLVAVGWFAASEKNLTHRDPAIVAVNVALMFIYCGIAYYLARTAVGDHVRSGAWFLSGVSLCFIFITCALMHLTYAGLVSNGIYSYSVQTLVIDVLAVPAGIYFLWVNRTMYHARSRGALA